MSASIESTFDFHPPSDALTEQEREHDAAPRPTRDGERRPAAQSRAEAHSTPSDGGYVADWVI